ncbi:DUF3307 domain-containing protein [Neobacillus drentensis]|uniref:DUF3307 domain-containing protein n=1 Tax=Neobacillus drentensis TaxID=220684 RepID=UPI002FFEC02D
MLFLSLVLAHFIADFYLQTDDMVIEKQKNLKKHVVHHLLLTAIVLVGDWIFQFHFENPLKNLLIPLIFIVITHLLIDFIKIKLIYSTKMNNEDNMKRLGFFVIDQLLHIGVIILGCELCFNFNLVRYFQQPGGLGLMESVLFMFIMFILGTTVSGHMIKILLGTLPNQLLTFEGKYSFKNERKEADFVHMGKKGLTEEYNYTIFSKHDLSRGKLIGYIERLLVLLLTFYSAYPAIGFIVAAKSIARFKQMDDRDWAEYFLLGTLTSMFLGIALGILLKVVLT